MAKAKKSNAPKGFDTIHRILGGAMREADPAAWPATPHLGGPLPVLATATQVAIGIEIAAYTRAALPPPSPRAFDALVKLAKRVAAGERIPYDELDQPSKAAKTDAPADRVAKLAVRAALNHLHASVAGISAVGTAVQNAAAALVRHLAGGGPIGVRAALLAIDDAILRCDLAAQLAERKLVPTSPIARVLARPKATAKGGLGLVLARLAGGDYGLYVKLKQKWEWHEGDRATVFATVPDAFMTDVAERLDAAG